MFAFLKQWELYAFIAAAAFIVGAWSLDHYEHGKAMYEKGYAAAVQKQTEAIVAYQDIVVKKEQEKAEALAVLSTEHAREIAIIETRKPREVEKTRVIVQQIDRPAVCNLTDVELRDFNEAVRASNGSG